MKTFELSQNELVDLSADEMKNTEGGILPLIAYGFIVGCWGIQTSICLGLMAIYANRGR
ncbi:MAG: hypothetical protein PHS30_00785 [Bacteroidales bacterium]|nr:hypothetical protein [Bacteroidales bacterium]